MGHLGACRAQICSIEAKVLPIHSCIWSLHTQGKGSSLIPTAIKNQLVVEAGSSVLNTLGSLLSWKGIPALLFLLL